MTEDVAPPKPSSGLTSRRGYVRAFGLLVGLSIAVDPSLYVAHVTHIYVHDVTTLLIGILGVILAVRNRTLLPRGPLYLVPMALFVFVLANMVLVGALQYHNVPANMHKLFWFEHGDAARIVGELFACTWTLGLLQPSRDEAWWILDAGLWGSTVNVGLVAAHSILTDTPHETTTAFDPVMLTGLPLAAVFVVRTRARITDLIRLVVFGAGSELLYSRATILTVVFTTAVVLLAIRSWRKAGAALASIAAGWLIVLLLPPLLVIGPSNFVGGTTLRRAMSIGNTQLAPYTIPSRARIWRDALRISTISPIIGVGYHDYFLYSQVTEIKNDSASNPPDLFSSLIKAAHNDYLSWLSETGALGFLIFLAFWGMTLLIALRMWRGPPEERAWRAFTLALILSIIGISVFGEVLIPRSPEWVSPALIWWIVIGLLYSDADRRRESLARARR